jgi:hypothetical protein
MLSSRGKRHESLCEEKKAPARKSLDPLGRLTGDIDVADLFSSRLGRRLQDLPLERLTAL